MYKELLRDKIQKNEHKKYWIQFYKHLISNKKMDFNEFLSMRNLPFEDIREACDYFNKYQKNGFFVQDDFIKEGRCRLLYDYLLITYCL